MPAVYLHVSCPSSLAAKYDLIYPAYHLGMPMLALANRVSLMILPMWTWAPMASNSATLSFVIIVKHRSFTVTLRLSNVSLQNE